MHKFSKISAAISFPEDQSIEEYLRIFNARSIGLTNLHTFSPPLSAPLCDFSESQELILGQCLPNTSHHAQKYGIYNSRFSI